MRDGEGWWYKYEGEVDEDGKACGEGVAKFDNGTGGRIAGARELRGMFYDNTFEGISKSVALL